MTAAVHDQQLMVVSAVVYHGAHLFMAQRLPHICEYAEEKRREWNLFVRSSKSEAQLRVTNNKRLRSTY